MTYDVERIEFVARAISKSKGRNPDEKTSYGFNPAIAERFGFGGRNPYEEGVWLCDIEEAARFIAAFDAAQATYPKG